MIAAGSGLAATRQPVLIAFSLLWIGAHQHRLGLLGHEAAHRLLSSTRWMNDAVGAALCMWPLTVSLEGYRRYHINHHRKLSTDQDPELDFRGGRAYRPPRSRIHFVLQFLGDLVGAGLPEVLRFSWGVRPPTPLSAMGMAAFWSALVLLAIHFDAVLPLCVYTIALGTSLWGFTRIRVWTEHVGVSGTHRISVGPPVLRYFILPHNTWCHYEHHANPGIGYQFLPTARIQQLESPVLALSTLFDGFAQTGRATRVHNA
jgi:fatty acid desaturase